MPRRPIELARKHYEQLPSVLKQALFSTDIAEKMFEIGKKFGLTIEKTGIMAEETGYVMLGLARPNELVGNLASGLQVNADKAQDVAAEINHQIFFPLREELKRTHNFDMDMGEIAGVVDTNRVSGMQMPPSIKKTFVEEKSPLVSDLTRITERAALPMPAQPAVKPPLPVQVPPSAHVAPQPPAPPAKTATPYFEPFASPTGRITDLHKMVEKPPLPVVAPAPVVVQPQAESAVPKPESKPKPPAASGVEPWEKDMEEEVSSLLTQKPAPQPPRLKEPPPIDLRPQQKPPAPQPMIPSKLPPIDLREQARTAPPTVTPPAVPPVTPVPTQDKIPSAPRMTPQLQDLPEKPSGPTLLQEKLRAEPQEKATPPAAAPAPLVNAPGGSDPYREPIDETNV